MLEIKTKKSGAELTSIKLNGKEKLHQGKEYWNRHAPILFPIVGQIKDGQTIIENKIYKMGQHGFARDMEFEEISTNKFLLKSSKETLEKYPYKFELYISYIIKDDELITEYKVTNKDDKQILFGIGGHPGFLCNYSTGEYRIEFNKKEEEIEFMKLQNGLISSEKCPNLIEKNSIQLTENIFKNDAIIMKKIKSNVVTLYKGNVKILEFDFTGFPYLALWSKIGAPFVCIEPWYNTADKIDSNGYFKDKTDILKLEPEQEFECKYKVRFYEGE